MTPRRESGMPGAADQLCAKSQVAAEVRWSGHLRAARRGQGCGRRESDFGMSLSVRLSRFGAVALTACPALSVDNRATRVTDLRGLFGVGVTKRPEMAPSIGARPHRPRATAESLMPDHTARRDLAAAGEPDELASPRPPHCSTSRLPRRATGATSATGRAPSASASTAAVTSTPGAACTTTTTDPRCLPSEPARVQAEAARNCTTQEGL